MNREPKPLYRKINKLVRNHRHLDTGGEYRHDRHTKVLQGMAEGGRLPITQGKLRGLDYAPLYRFLLSKVGKPWADVYKEAVSRLDKEEPIFHLVELEYDHEIHQTTHVCTGYASYYSALKVDEQGLLQKIDPTFDGTKLTQFCPCCMMSFNGVPVPMKKVA